MVEEKWSGSFTVEAAVLVSAVLLLTYGVIMAVFYYHDKNILTGTAYETAVIAGRKQKKRTAFSERRNTTIMERKNFRKDDSFSESRGRSRMSEGVCVDFSSSIEEKNEDYSRSKSSTCRAGEKDPGYEETKKGSRNRNLKIGYRRDLNTSYFIVEFRQVLSIGLSAENAGK